MKKDEEFHARLGDMIVRKYVVTDEHRANGIWRLAVYAKKCFTITILFTLFLNKLFISLFIEKQIEH
ncbi:hypothetical protein AC623_08570 [Bacillus sp. FJAT-27231]|nr:hypothetical protein AC623_08570 [Bacillus sp. FJAT-27231]